MKNLHQLFLKKTGKISPSFLKIQFIKNNRIIEFFVRWQLFQNSWKLKLNLFNLFKTYSTTAFVLSFTMNSERLVLASTLFSCFGNISREKIGLIFWRFRIQIKISPEKNWIQMYSDMPNTYHPFPWILPCFDESL